MRFAYLIIAHNEFDILRILVSKLDSEHNDIYIHFDKKLRRIPDISTSKSRLFITGKRLDVRWGHVSQIECEFCLWEEAVKNGPYDFYVLLSGVHLPLKSLPEVEAFFAGHKGENILPFFRQENGYQKTLKMNRFNFFLREFAYGPEHRQRLFQKAWRLCNMVQEKLGISHNDEVEFFWSSNWVSLTQEAVEYLLSIKQSVLNRYRYSFCGDEWFVATELWNSDFKDTIIPAEKFLYCKIERANAETYSFEDYQRLQGSGCLFARKFSAKIE